jgi:hypothetical protein
MVEPSLIRSGLFIVLVAHCPNPVLPAALVVASKTAELCPKFFPPKPTAIYSMFEPRTASIARFRGVVGYHVSLTRL